MKIKRLLSIILCLCMVLAAVPAAFADDTVTDAEEMRLINDSEIEGIITDYLKSKNISTDKVSIGFRYTGTGDEWFLNGDEWIYPASLYKVPLMMLLSEKVKAGELTQESNIGGMTVSQIEEYILVYSNNEWAHTIRAYLGGDEAWRAEAKKYSQLEDSAYSQDYMTYCYFSARYMTNTIGTLYASPDSYPNILECMGQVKPREYLRTYLEGQFTIAQKYGSYIEPNGTWNNHAAGVIYTPNPIIVTVMTRNVDNYNDVIGKIGELLAQYALTLDSKIEIFEQQKLAAKVAAEQAAADQAAAEQRAAEEAEKAAAEKAAADKAAAEAAAKEAAKAKRQAALKKVIKLGVSALAIAVLAGVGAVILSKNNKKASRSSPNVPAKKSRRDYADEERWADEPDYEVKPSVRAKPVREERVYRETVPPDDGEYRRKVRTEAEEMYGRDNAPARENRAYRTTTFTEKEFKAEDAFDEDSEWEDDETDQGFVFRRAADRPAKTGNSLRDSKGEMSRGLKQSNNAGKKRSYGSSSASGSRKRGKHELR